MRKASKLALYALSLTTILTGCSNVLNDHSPIKPGELRRRLDKDYAKNHPPIIYPPKTAEDIQREIQNYELNRSQGIQEEYHQPSIERVALHIADDQITKNFDKTYWIRRRWDEAKAFGEWVEENLSIDLGPLNVKVRFYSDEIRLMFSAES